MSLVVFVSCTEKQYNCTVRMYSCAELMLLWGCSTRVRVVLRLVCLAVQYVGLFLNKFYRIFWITLMNLSFEIFKYLLIFFDIFRYLRFFEFFENSHHVILKKNLVVFWLPESFNTNILHQHFDYTITFVNS